MIAFDRYYGLGDSLYMRPFVMEAKKYHDEVYVCTPFPELYWADYGIKFLKPDTELKTQKKNIKLQSESLWAELPPKCEVIRMCYHDQKIYDGKTIIESFRLDSAFEPNSFYIPINPEWIYRAKMIANGKKICLVKFPSCRHEWHNFSRNPRMEYINLIIKKHRKDYTFISVADNTEEWFDGIPEKVDLEFNHGNLHWTTVFGLIALSDMVLCSPGFIMLASIAMKAKCFCIFGGSIKPSILLDKSIMDLDKFKFVAPDPFCNCIQNQHRACNKEISETEILHTFEWLEEI